MAWCELEALDLMLRKRQFADVEKAIGYRFKDQALLGKALTHSSANAGGKDGFDNERLEFVGDRVLGLVISSYLCDCYPDDNEGELARRFNRLVRRDACARVGRNIDIGAHLILSDAEEASGGRKKSTIIADAVEALLAAVFLDGGYDKARAVVLKLWQALDDIELAGPVADAKSALQEWVQGRGLGLPRYNVVSRTGPDHAPKFVTEVEVEGLELASGQGSSKRASEQSAATAMLEREGVWDVRE